MIVREILQRSAGWLHDKGFESSRLEAELLLAHVLGTERLGLYAAAEEDLSEETLEAYRALLRRRAEGEPVAYLTGSREFYSLEFTITRDVLVPRPETELIVDRVRELAPETLLDLGTGSGCIAVACAVRLPEAEVTATDLSEAALGVARGNAERHGVAGRIRFLCGDLFAALPEAGGAGERFEVVVSNPPYTADRHPAGHEPPLALQAGPRGLDVIARLVEGAPGHLAGGGTLLVEIADDQEEAVRDLAGRVFRELEIHRDLAGLPRLLEARAPAEA